MNGNCSVELDAAPSHARCMINFFAAGSIICFPKLEKTAREKNHPTFGSVRDLFSVDAFACIVDSSPHDTVTLVIVISVIQYYWAFRIFWFLQLFALFKTFAFWFGIVLHIAIWATYLFVVAVVGDWPTPVRGELHHRSVYTYKLWKWNWIRSINHNVYGFEGDGGMWWMSMYVEEKPMMTINMLGNMEIETGLWIPIPPIWINM